MKFCWIKDPLFRLDISQVKSKLDSVFENFDIIEDSASTEETIST